MDRPPSTGTSIAAIADELGVPAQRVLQRIWAGLPDVAALTVDTMLSPRNADRARELCRAIPVQRSPDAAAGPGTQAPQLNRTPSGHEIPLPAPPTSPFAHLQALRALQPGGRDGRADDGLDALREQLGIGRGSGSTDHCGRRRTRRPSRAERERTDRRNRDRERAERRRIACSQLARELRNGYHYRDHDADRLATEWVDQFVMGYLQPPETVLAWWSNDYGPGRLQEVLRLHGAGVHVEMLDVRIGSDTVRKMLRRGDPPHLITRLLKDHGHIP